jgi:hypothetical protein
MLPHCSQRPSKPTQPYDPIPLQPRKQASTTTFIAPSISKKSCSNNLPSFTQTRIAAEALQQLFHSAEREAEAVEDQLETWTENEEEEEVIDERLSLSLDWPDWTMGLGPDWTGLLNQQSGPKIKDRTVKQSPFLIRTRLKLL